MCFICVFVAMGSIKIVPNVSLLLFQLQFVDLTQKQPFRIGDSCWHFNAAGGEKLLGWTSRSSLFNHEKTAMDLGHSPYFNVSEKRNFRISGFSQCHQHLHAKFRPCAWSQSVILTGIIIPNDHTIGAQKTGFVWFLLKILGIDLLKETGHFSCWNLAFFTAMLWQFTGVSIGLKTLFPLLSYHHPYHPIKRKVSLPTFTVKTNQIYR